MFGQHDSHVAYCWYVATYRAYYVFFPIQMALASRIQFCVVRHVIVALRQDFWTIGLHYATKITVLAYIVAQVHAVLTFPFSQSQILVPSHVFGQPYVR